jgi:hypothetical protein
LRSTGKEQIGVSIPRPGGRALIYLALVAALGISLLPLGSTTHATQPIYFAETNHTVSGRFLAAWQGPYSYQESVAINGYPISDVQEEVNPTDGKTYQVQWFQRARFEYHPETPPPNDVQFGLLGNIAAQGRRDEPPFRPVARPAALSAALSWFPETEHTLQGPFLDFWTRYGSWKQFGFPISEMFTEPSKIDGKSYVVQYFERARFELHPGLAPEFGGVVLGQLGTEQYHPPAATGTPAQP